MKLSFEWLKKYVNLPDSVPAQEVAEKLKLATVEVEGVELQGALLGHVVVGKVLSAEKHPQADKLKLCQVDVKNEKLQIVCGGSNVRAGMLVALAKVGAKVKWHGQDELMELKPTAIRGVESFGMICSASEIGLEAIYPPKEEKEIIDLSGTLAEKQVGKPLAEILGLNDTVFEIDNKSLSHRPDLWGHYGMAREVAALFGKSLKEYKTNAVKAAKKTNFSLAVEVPDAKLCPRYMAVAVSGIKIGESPEWLKKELSAAGLRPINNIVDITNYLMLDLGQPMHAFDAAQLARNKEQGVKIVVRPAEEGEVLTLLDGNKIELTPEDLVIADGEKPLALAGVMGGESSGINEKTETIIFESANFNASSIRKTSVRHGLRTDSSARFEKGLDPNWCELALNKAVELTLKFCPGAAVTGGVKDAARFSLATGPIVVEKNIFAKKLGEDIPEKATKKILESLGFAVKDKGDKLSVIIPSWRATKDVAIAEDLVEEVARIWGYDKIKSAMPEFKIIAPEKNFLRILENNVRAALVKDMAFDEVYNYSFVSQQQIDWLGDRAAYVELGNPLSKEKPFLRRSLLPNLLENTVKNIEYFDPIKIFEIGKVFWPDLPGVRSDTNGGELLPRQDTFICAVYAGKKVSNPFSSVRRVVKHVLESVNLNFEIKEPAVSAPWAHPTRSGEIICEGGVIGAIYELSPFTAKKFGLASRVAVLEINFDLLVELAGQARGIAYERLPEFPLVTRDLAFTVGKNITHAQIKTVLSGVDNLIKNVELFDVYSGQGVAENKKSLAYRLTLADPERTLNSAEVDVVVKKAADVLKKKFEAEVRS
ncbi:MAG: phenylalanine--tRNA ligase subunit beta [Patescibacteria group bacterium]|nr:phenylalanine--tRNA ligase subunit beta [Patescibacteria group bacterium]